MNAVRQLFLQGWERLRSRRLDYEYIDWLCFANAGMLNRGNVLCFDHAIRNLPEGAAVLEIGSFCGLSTNVIAFLAAKHEKRIRFFTCDTWMFENADGPSLPDSPISRQEYRQFCRDSFLRNVRFFSRASLPYTIEVVSDVFFGMWERSEEATDVFERSVRLGGPLHFVYVDGNHTYAATRRDFENSDRALAPGGFILLDDSAASAPFECYRVAKEVEREGRYRMVMHNPNYLFQKK